MSLEKPEETTPESIARNEVKISIPKEEIMAIWDIQNYWAKLLEETEHNVMISKASKEKVTKKYQELLAKIDHPIAAGSKEDLSLYREAEYLENQTLVDNRQALIKKLISHIEEKKGIWKHKFSTSNSVQINQYDDKGFSGNGQESKDRDAIQSFAGQSRDSLYYVTNSGATIRLKVDLLFHDDTTRYKDILRPPKEKIIFVNKIARNKDYKVVQDGKTIFLHDMCSEIPTLDYNVEEFESQTFDTSIHDQDFQSPISTINTEIGLEIKNFTEDHSGHQVNQIWEIQ